jgi:hypothetical protein
MKLFNSKYIPLTPSCFVHNGASRDFTGPQLQRFVVGIQEPEYSVVLGEQYKFMVLPELRGEILKAASAQNYSACETILKHISERFSEEDYRNSVSDYQHALLTKNRMKTLEQTKCAKMISAGKGSVYNRCGHYGVPMHQVVNDAEGHCRMKSSLERERLNPVQESGASISSAKVFMS